MGIFFSFGWSPCVGPILGSILTALATSGMTISQGIIYLSIYSAGLAIPFLVAAWGMGWVTTILQKYSRVMRYVEIAMGILLIIVGIALGVGLINQLQFLGPGVNFGI
jgi:cytochrome c-type biogenesis protein